MPGVNRGSIAKDAVGPERTSPSVVRGRYCFETFMSEPSVHVKGSFTEPLGTSLTEQVLMTGRHKFEYYFLGDNTDLLIPTLASEGGYNWGGNSNVVATGFEVCFGGVKDGHPRNFKPSGEDFFARILLITDDASGVDTFFGFRKNADAPVATLTEVTDLFGIRILGNSDSTEAAFTLVSVLNNGGSTDYTSTTTTVTGLEDATAVELEVRVRGRRAYAYVNGVEVSQGRSLAYDFDTGDFVTPVWRFLQMTDIAAQMKTLAFECGLIDDRQDGTLLSLAGSTT